MEAQAELPSTRTTAAIFLIIDGRRIFRVGIFIGRRLQGERNCLRDRMIIHRPVGGVTA